MKLISLMSAILFIWFAASAGGGISLHSFIVTAMLASWFAMAQILGGGECGGGGGGTITPALSSLTLNPASVLGGNSSTGTVTLNTAAPAGGAVVTLTSSDTNTALVPASVTVAAGATTATFTVTTISVASTTAVTITGNYGGQQRSASLSVTAPPVLTPIYGGVGLAGATSGTLVGTNVTLDTGDVLPQLQTTAEQIGQSWSFLPNNQNVYLLLRGGTHTFVDANTGFFFAFNLPLAITIAGATMYLYQSTNALFVPVQPRVQT